MSGVETAVATLAVVGGVLESYGEYQEGKYQSKVARANAKILEANADRTRLETALNEDIQREENRRAMARNYATAVEQGMSDSATSVGVLGQQEADLEQNVLNLRYKGLSEAERYDIESYYKKQEAKQLKRQAKVKFHTGLINSGISGAKSYYSMGGGANGK